MGGGLKKGTVMKTMKEGDFRGMTAEEVKSGKRRKF